MDQATFYNWLKLLPFKRVEKRFKKYRYQKFKCHFLLKQMHYSYKIPIYSKAINQANREGVSLVAARWAANTESQN